MKERYEQRVSCGVKEYSTVETVCLEAESAHVAGLMLQEEFFFFSNKKIHLVRPAN